MERQMRLVVSMVALVFGTAMLLPAATARPAFAQVEPSASVAPSASVPPSASVEPSEPPLPDAEVELDGGTFEPVANWAIAVTGGTPSVDFVEVDDIGGAFFTVNVFGQSATLEMTATLPTGSQLTLGECRVNSLGPDIDVLVAPDRLVIEVVQGTNYSCLYVSDAPVAPVPPKEGPAPTAPPTDSLPVGQTGSSSGDWPLMLALMAAVLAASIMIAVRARIRS